MGQRTVITHDEDTNGALLKEQLQLVKVIISEMLHFLPVLHHARGKHTFVTRGSRYTQAMGISDTMSSRLFVRWDSIRASTFASEHCSCLYSTTKDASLSELEVLPRPDRA